MPSPPLTLFLTGLIPQYSVPTLTRTARSGTRLRDAMRDDDETKQQTKQTENPPRFD